LTTRDDRVGGGPLDEGLVGLAVALGEEVEGGEGDGVF
jgi:hypothetical protein